MNQWSNKSASCGGSSDGGVGAACDHEADSRPWAWRSGNRLVVVEGTTLPKHCVKCNRTNELSLVRVRLHWEETAGVLFGGPVTSKRGRLQLWLCQYHRRRGRIAFVMTCVLALLSVACATVCVLAEWQTLGFASIVPLAVALGCWRFYARTVSVKRTEGDLWWLTGASPEYLAQLPELRTSGQRGPK